MKMIRVELENRYTNACQWAGDVEDQGSAAKNRGAAVKKAIGEGSDLRGAYLRGAYLRYAYLTGADLRGAYLTGADLRDADLTGADLRDADLRDADLPTGYRIARLDFGGWPVTVTPEHTTIGGQRHANAGWLEWTPESPEIARMHPDAPTWWARHCEAVRAVIRDVMQP